MRLPLAFLAGLFLAAPFPAADDPFREARELFKVHREKDAFLRLLAFPGAEPYAAALARSRPQQFLDILVREDRDVPVERRALVDGELRLVRTLRPPEVAARTGRPLAAVYCRRQVLGMPDGRAGRKVLRRGAGQGG